MTRQLVLEVGLFNARLRSRIYWRWTLRALGFASRLQGVFNPVFTPRNFSLSHDNNEVRIRIPVSRLIADVILS